MRDYLHKLGYSFKNEYFSVNEMREKYHQEGILILEDLGFSSYVYLKLYRNNIYTLEDLLKYGRNVFNIDNFGLKHKRELELKIEDLGLSFDLNLEEQIDMLKKYSQIYKKNIRTQEELNRIYQSLLLKKQALLGENAKLDEILTNLKKKNSKVLSK